MKNEFKACLISSDRIQAKSLLEKTVSTFGSKVLEELIGSTLQEIGSEWEEGKLSLSQVYMAGRITEDIVQELFPIQDCLLSTIAMVTLDDYHLLGKRLVLSVLRSTGYAVLDYGRTDIDQLVQKIKHDKIQILLVSILMYRSALSVKELKEKLVNIPVKIVVGGAPFRLYPQLWKTVGADAVGKTAADAIDILQKLGAKNEQF